MSNEIQFGDAVIKPYVTFNGSEVAIHPTGQPQAAETPWGSDEELAPDSDNDSPLSIDNTVFPRVASQTIRGMSAAERAEWTSQRLRCKTDQLFLSNVLGMDLQENPHRALFAQFLQKRPGTPISDLDPVYKKRMILWSRNTCKTTSSRVEMCQIILNYPNVRICFLTGNDDLAKRQLGGLKQIFERPTPEFLRLFPEYCLTSRQNKRTKEWTDELDELGPHRVCTTD